jgi:hypothetical protein
MSIMSELFLNIEKLAGSARDYINTRVEVVKLNAAAKVSSVTSNIVARIIVGIVFVFFLFFGGMAAGFALGEWLGKTYWGFLVVAAFYLLAAVIVWLARERMIRMPIMNAIIQQLFKENDHDKNQEY